MDEPRKAVLAHEQAIQYGWQKAFMQLAAKQVALIEAAVELNGGDPIVVRADRINEIILSDPLTMPIEDVALSVEEGDGEGNISFRLGTLDEVEEFRHREALRRMGPSRN